MASSLSPPAGVGGSHPALMDLPADPEAMAFLALTLRGVPFKIRKTTVQMMLACKKSLLAEHILAGHLPPPHQSGTPGAFWWSHEIEPALRRMAGLEAEDHPEQEAKPK